MKHLRNTEECNGLEELEPIDRNLQYDFNYQQMNVLPRTARLLPVSNDWLHLCTSHM